jgi:DNA mismatch repair protein MutS
VSFKITWTDVFQSIAMASLKLNLKRPILKEGDTSSIECEDLRHILVENAFKNTNNVFVANDVNLNNNNYLIFGINSVGKSVYLKSIGIAVILAQSGLFVPANECVLTPYKKVFTRFGNGDDLSRNHSSFISEIYEIETIITNCDSNSLVIADECCSSTELKSATEIVSSTLKWLSEKKTSFVFSSHFFELINKVKCIETLSIAYLKITETKDDIIFDRKLTIGFPVNINYGTKIALNIFTNKNFKKMLEQTDGFKEKKVIKSRYNSSLIVKNCTICGYAPEKETDLPLDVHHIGMQADADQNGFLNNIHKNNMANLVVLCKACHQNTHKGKITINGWQTSLNGSKLDYVINKRL